MVNPIQLTRDQLKEFLPNPRTIKAFENLISVAGITTPGEIIVIQELITELTAEQALSEAKVNVALDLLAKIEKNLSVIAAAPAVIPITQGNELALASLAPMPNSVVYIDQPYLEDSDGGTVLTSGVVTTIAGVTLTPGDWEVFGYCAIDTDAITTMTQAVAGAHTSPSGYGPSGSYWQFQGPSLTGAILSFPIPTLRFEVTVDTNVYLNTLATFAASTAQAYGKISARKIFKGAV